MPLEVIGAGFGRTGTNSLKLALEILGYDKCHHMKEVIPNLEQLHYWDKISRGEKQNWDDVFKGYKASVDWPSSAYYKELAEYYPDAKIVLGIRDPEAWYKSVSETIYPLSTGMPRWLKKLNKRIGTFAPFVNRTIWHGIFEDKFDDKEFALKVFRDHIEEVKQSIPPERLLLHQAKDGWEPLCQFLNKPVPDTPYPRVNEAKEFKRILFIQNSLRHLPIIIVIILLITFFLI